MTYFDIALDKQKILAPHALHGERLCTPHQVITLNKEIGNLGFTLSDQGWRELFKASTNELVHIHQLLVSKLSKIVGVHNYTPMYPDFPDQVMSADSAELYFNAIMHYSGFVVSDLIGDPSLVVLPDYTPTPRDPISKTEYAKLKQLDVVTMEWVNQYIGRLCQSSVALTPSEKEALAFHFRPAIGRPTIVDMRIPNKENLAVVIAASENWDLAATNVSSANDVLRIAVAMSDGDVSLATPTKFIKFSRKTRRNLLSLIELVSQHPSALGDMMRFESYWVRLGERLHPGEYRKRFPETYKRFQALREPVNYRAVRSVNNFHSVFDRWSSVAPHVGAKIASEKRPGHLVRSLNHLLQRCSNTQERHEVITHLANCVDDVSTPVLMQALTYFDHRSSNSPYRVFLPKGQVAKMFVKDQQLPELLPLVVREVRTILSQAICRRYHDNIGAYPIKTYIDPRLQHVSLPFALRSAQKQVRQLTRGSAFDLRPDLNTVRLFMWWKNQPKERVDLDLSGAILGEDFAYLGDLSYYNLRDTYGYHSGDITSAPNGACEFIDVNLEKVPDEVHYIVPNIISFTGQQFKDIPEASAGWMMRDKPQTGKIYDPRTVQDRFDLTSEAQAAVPFVIDVKNRKAIWIDVVKQAGCFSNSAKSFRTISNACKAAIHIVKPTIYQAATMYANTNGDIVSDPGDADLVFCVDQPPGCHQDAEIVTAFDTDKLIAKLLP